MAGETHNDFSGTAQNVVQAGTISGGVHVHHHPAALSTLIPRQLPADTAHFTDREEHLGALDDWLEAAHGQVAPVNLIAGVGGVGKTSLAAHWAHRVRERFPDGDLYLNLHGYHAERSVSADEALDRLLRAFDIPGDRIPADRDARAALYRSLLHGRRMLVVLDNAAHIDQIRPLLPGSPTCWTLVTSRDQLGGLVVRDGAGRISLPELTAGRAAELVARVAGAERVRAEPAAVDELVRYCGNLPLALCIAAEKLASDPGLPVAELVEELAEERERLDVLSVDGDDSATVRAVFSWSYRSLRPDLARMFRLLSLPSGPDISAPAAAVLCETTATAARRALTALVDAHLLDWDPRTRRYRFHDLLRVYAAECAEADEPEPERRRALRRLFGWYAHTAQAAARVFAPGFTSIPVSLPEPWTAPPAFADRLAALHWCDAELDNLVAAVDKAQELGEHRLAWQLPVTLFGYFIARRTLEPWVQTHAAGLRAARLDGARAAEVWLLTSSAIAARDLHRHESAIEDFEAAIAGWREIGERWGEAWALRDLGGVYHHLGRDREATATLERARAMHIEEQDAWGEATASSMLAAAYQHEGRLEEALACLGRALEIRRAQNDRRNVGRVLNEYGSVYDALGRTDEAVRVLTDALEIHAELDNWHGEATAREQLGATFARIGQRERAREQWTQAVDLYARLGDPRAEVVLRRLGELAPPAPAES